MQKNKSFFFKLNKWHPSIFFLVIFFVAIVIALYQNFCINLGWIYLTKGVDQKNKDLITLAQSILFKHTSSVAQEERYSILIKEKLNYDQTILNGGFEFFTQNWVILGTDSVLPRITNEQSYSGHQSLEITFLNSDINFYQTFQKVEVIPSTCYILKAETKAKNLTDIIALEVWDAERGYQYWYGGRTTTVEGTTDWMPISLCFCTGDDIQSVQVRIRRYGGYGKTISGTIWIDDVSLRIASQE